MMNPPNEQVFAVFAGDGADLSARKKAAASAAVKSILKGLSADGGVAGYSSPLVDPRPDGTVALAGSDPVFEAWKLRNIGEQGDEYDLNLCDKCHCSPCFLVEKHEEIAEFFQELLDTSPLTNKERRFRCYRHLTMLYRGYLGKGNRKKLPFCVTGEICDTFPHSPGEPPVGFKARKVNNSGEKENVEGNI